MGEVVLGSLMRGVVVDFYPYGKYDSNALSLSPRLHDGVYLVLGKKEDGPRDKHGVTNWGCPRIILTLRAALSVEFGWLCLQEGVEVDATTSDVLPFSSILSVYRVA